MNRARSILFLVTLIVLMFTSPVSADIAPPQQPPGFNLEPGTEFTQVRMLAETVTIDVLGVDPPQAHFSAVFSMRNLSKKAEYLAVRFPIAASDGFSDVPEIENVLIRINERTTGFTRTQGNEPIYGFENERVPWAEFEVSFPPGEDVTISVSYDLDGTSYDYETCTSFSYILSTGAGWNGTIGSGEIILSLPYGASPQYVILDDPQNTGRSSWQGSPQFSGNEVRWTFVELEPTASDNITFDIVKPAIWNQVVAGLENTAQDPKDGEAWGFLGKAYKQAFFASSKGYPRVDEGANELYQLNREAYEQAVTLKPEDGLWHAGYAELLLDGYYWASYPNRSYTPELDLGLRELDLAVRLSPESAKVRELMEEYLYMFPEYILQQADGSFIFLSLTETPQIARKTMLPIGTPVPVLTDTSPASRPSPGQTDSAPGEATPQAQSTPQPASPLCGGMMLFLLPLALFLFAHRSS